MTDEKDIQDPSETQDPNDQPSASTEEPPLDDPSMPVDLPEDLPENPPTENAETPTEKPDVKRIGRRDRKSRVRVAGPLFSTDEEEDPRPLEQAPSDEPTVAETEPVAEHTKDLTDEGIERDTADLALEEIETHAFDFDDADDDLYDDDEEEDQLSEEELAFFAPRTSEHEDRFPPLPSESFKQAQLREPPPSAYRESYQPVETKRNRGKNFFTCLVLLMTLLLAGFIIYIWRNPYSPLNPLPPFTPLPIIITATLTETYTPEPTVTYTPSATFTPQPTRTPSPSATPTPETVDEAIAESTAEIQADAADYPFAAQIVSGRSFVYLENPSGRGGCNWSSIGGAVTSISGAGIQGHVIRITGENVDEELLSGSSNAYGPGGFELSLGTTARDATYNVQLLDSTGIPLTPEYTVLTSARCDWNMSIIRFVEVAE